MLASENGIRVSHSCLKYARIDIRNRKLTKVCLTARTASHRRKYCRVGSGEDKRVTLAGSALECAFDPIARSDQRRNERLDQSQRTPIAKLPGTGLPSQNLTIGADADLDVVHQQSRVVEVRDHRKCPNFLAPSDIITGWISGR